MNKTAISWTNHSWNFVHGCSKVSDGCKHCYAMELSLKRGWTEKPWTIQNEDANVMMKPHKLVDAYGKDVEAGQRIFVNSMSDMFHRSIPDWYKAVGFCLMLDRDDVVFQILTKRPHETIDWHERFLVAIGTPEFLTFRKDLKLRKGRWAKVYAALLKAESYRSPWADHIWMGTSVEDARVIDRIDALRQSKAHVRFISAEPLLGPYPAGYGSVSSRSTTHCLPAPARTASTQSDLYTAHVSRCRASRVTLIGSFSNTTPSPK